MDNDSMTSESFAKSAQHFTKSPLGIIALFIVLVYGFASLVVTFGNDISQHLTPLIYFMVLFPFTVFAGFLWLVAKHHTKLYGPSDYRTDESFLNTLLTSTASLAAATAKRNVDNDTEVYPQALAKTVLKVSSLNQQKTRGKRILWVDDNPDNNIYERQAFEAQGVEFTLAQSTREAMEHIKTTQFSAVISDMGRREGSREGFVLLQQMRNIGNKTPFIIYAGSNAPEHKEMARKAGAVDSTNRADDLFKIVMNVISRS